jgi:hypothetical protein
MPPPEFMRNTDRMRFFKEYLSQNEKTERGKKVLIKKVLKKTRRRLNKKREVSKLP